jgi:hypothetical protein
LTGLAFAVCAVVAFLSSQKPPGSKANGATVISFYTAHSAGQQRSDYFWFLAFTFLLLFAGSLRGYLRRTPAVEGLGALSLAGASALAVGATIYFGFDYVLATVSSHLDPAAAQTLNELALNLVFPFAVGGCVFGIASGLAILRGAQLPTWLGWAAIVIGLAMATPAALIGIVLFIFWTAIVSVLLVRRTEPTQSI